MPTDRARRPEGRSSTRSGSDAGTYFSSATRDPHSDRYARSGSDRHKRSRREAADDDALERKLFPKASAKRELKAIDKFRMTRDQLFSTAPCTGALYVIMTLVVFWFVGIVYGAVIFTKSCRQIGRVEDVENMKDAMDLIWSDKKAQGAMVVLATFVGSMAFIWLYLGVVVLYITIIQKKRPYLWMKEREARNEKDREGLKEKRRAKAWGVISANLENSR